VTPSEKLYGTTKCITKTIEQKLSKIWIASWGALKTGKNSLIFQFFITFPNFGPLKILGPRSFNCLSVQTVLFRTHNIDLWSSRIWLWNVKKSWLKTFNLKCLTFGVTLKTICCSIKLGISCSNSTTTANLVHTVSRIVGLITVHAGNTGVHVDTRCLCAYIGFYADQVVF